MSKSQRQAALYLLRNRIVRGELPAGAKLRASHLANEMEFSRTPLSEALMALEAEGLLIGDKSGYTVRGFSLDDVLMAIELRGVLEAVAAQKAAERGVSEGQLSTLRDLLDAIDQVVGQGDTSEYDSLNEQFHKAVAACCGSPILIEEVERSYRFPFAGPSAFPARNEPSARFQASLTIGQAQHRAIVEAIASREGMRAFALMREHAHLAQDNVREAMKQQDGHPQLALVTAE
jgi:GntR family transcriptional regulator of vanillate catabolism